MAFHNLTKMMDDFTDIVNREPVEDASDRIIRYAGNAEAVVAIEALARLLVIESARRRHAEARLCADVPAED